AGNTTYLVPYAYASALPGSGGTRTWTTTMPATVGTYEARLFLNNGFTRGATGNTFTVANISPTPLVTAISPPTVVAGSAAFTMHVTGSNFVPGATATVGGTQRPVSLISSTQLDISIPASDVASVGSVAINVFNPPTCLSSGCVSNTTPLIVTPPPPPPSLTVSSTSVAAGQPVTVTLSNGAANALDCLPPPPSRPRPPP